MEQRRMRTMKYKPVTEWIGCGISTVFTVLQTNETWQIICLVLTAISITVTTAFTIYKWVKSATKDGKITEEELEEGVKIIQDGVENIKNTVEGGKKDGNRN